MKTVSGTDVLTLFFGASLMGVGLFHEYLACLSSVFLLVYLAVVLYRRGALHIRKNLTGLFLLLLVAGYGVSCLWAVDAGMAFIGFLKFLPVLLFWVAVLQQPHGTEQMMRLLPPLAAVMTVVAAVGMQIPPIAAHFSVAGRLAGFFQYPNTFAALLLVAELMVIMRDEHRVWDYAYVAVLLFGILYSGSRTVFLLAVPANAAALFIGKDKRFRRVSLIVVAALVAAVGVYMLLSRDTSLLDRLMSISFRESTFVGRLLYYRDALPVILRHPFGMGYMGYFYTQTAFQTGVYSVRYIHNEFLQVMLDVGWIPFAAMAAAVIATFVSKRVSIKKKLLLAVLVLHSCLDFDLQFIGVFFLFVLLLDSESGDERVLSLCGRRAIAVGVSGVLALGCLYMGVAQALPRVGAVEAAYRMYPAGTQSALTMLSETERIEEALPIADGILQRNDHVVAAHAVRARYAYSQGDFKTLIETKHRIAELAPFAYEEYEEYALMLVNGIALYSQAGDRQSVTVCQQELVWIQRQLNAQKTRLSELGALVADQPTTRLPDEIDRYIQEVRS